MRWALFSVCAVGVMLLQQERLKTTRAKLVAAEQSVQVYISQLNKIETESVKREEKHRKAIADIESEYKTHSVNSQRAYDAVISKLREYESSASTNNRDSATETNACESESFDAEKAKRVQTQLFERLTVISRYADDLRGYAERCELWGVEK